MMSGRRIWPSYRGWGCKNLTDAGLAHLCPLQGLINLFLPHGITTAFHAAFHAPG